MIADSTVADATRVLLRAAALAWSTGNERLAVALTRAAWAALDGTELVDTDDDETPRGTPRP